MHYHGTDNEGAATGIQCQLLNAIGTDEIGALLLHPEWWMQEKKDGRRLLIQKAGEEICGISRRGLRVALHSTLQEDAFFLPLDSILDGEAIGDELHVFDLLRLDGEDLRPKPYLVRFLLLMQLVSAWECRHRHGYGSAIQPQIKERKPHETNTTANGRIENRPRWAQ